MSATRTYFGIMSYLLLSLTSAQYIDIPQHEYHNIGETLHHQYPPFGRKNRSWSIWHLDPKESGGVTYPNEDLMWSDVAADIWVDEQGPYQPRKNQIYEFEIRNNDYEANKRWITMLNEFLSIPKGWSAFEKEKQFHIAKRQYPFCEMPRGGTIIGVLIDQWNWTFFHSNLKEPLKWPFESPPIYERPDGEPLSAPVEQQSWTDRSPTLAPPLLAEEAPREDFSDFREHLRGRAPREPAATTTTTSTASTTTQPVVGLLDDEPLRATTNPFKGRYRIDPDNDYTGPITNRSELSPFASLARMGYVKYPFEWPATVVPATEVNVVLKIDKPAKAVRGEADGVSGAEMQSAGEGCHEGACYKQEGG
eukprot:GHVH01015713.1.p2 GENE.GHVH01015713.1~~GHVH01015713.1.p2  ORF type:complete len:364 (-),score=61.17 GHVH01015713.1:1984-3075(-)